MRSYVLINALAAVAIVAPVQAQGQTKADPAIMALVDAFSDARNRFDSTALDRLLTPDYVEVSPRGEIDLRRDVLGFYAPDKAIPVPTMALSTQSLRRFGDVAIVIGSVDFAMPGPNGATVNRQLRVTYVGRRVRGRWLMASTHYTGVAGRQPAL